MSDVHEIRVCSCLFSVTISLTEVQNVINTLHSILISSISNINVASRGIVTQVKENKTIVINYPNKLYLS